jgi:hypothetical protein
VHFKDIISRLESSNDIDVDVISKPRDEYKTAGHAATGQPTAPAITIDDEVIVQGKDISDKKLKKIIDRMAGSK